MLLILQTKTVNVEIVHTIIQINIIPLTLSVDYTI